MSTTLPANWERICGARFRRRIEDVPSGFALRILQLAGCLNADEWLGIPPGKLCFGGVDWHRDATHMHLTWHPEIEPNVKSTVAYFDDSAELKMVELLPRARFADIFAGWELVGYLYREA